MNISLLSIFFINLINLTIKMKTFMNATSFEGCFIKVLVLVCTCAIFNRILTYKTIQLFTLVLSITVSSFLIFFRWRLRLLFFLRSLLTGPQPHSRESFCVDAGLLFLTFLTIFRSLIVQEFSAITWCLITILQH